MSSPSHHSRAKNNPKHISSTDIHGHGMARLEPVNLFHRQTAALQHLMMRASSDTWHFVTKHCATFCRNICGAVSNTGENDRRTGTHTQAAMNYVLKSLVPQKCNSCLGMFGDVVAIAHLNGLTCKHWTCYLPGAHCRRIGQRDAAANQIRACLLFTFLSFVQARWRTIRQTLANYSKSSTYGSLNGLKMTEVLLLLCRLIEHVGQRKKRKTTLLIWGWDSGPSPPSKGWTWKTSWCQTGTVFGVSPHHRPLKTRW